MGLPGFLLPQDFLDGTKSRTDFKAPNLIMDIIVAYGGSLPKMKIKGWKLLHEVSATGF